MSYNNNVPLANQQISATQAPILGNFQYIDTAMKVDHTWNGNNISTEAAGSHQRIDMPNQGADIVGALPSGIAAIMYAIGGNLFAWNGTTKNPVSAIAGSGTVNLTTAFIDVITIPANCIGLFVLQDFAPTLLTTGVANLLFFVNISSNPIQTIAGSHSQTALTIPKASPLKIQAAAVSGTINNVPYKYIYWPI